MRSNKMATFDVLEEFLDKERRAILGGLLKDMSRIAKEKERLLDKENFRTPDRKTLDRIRRKVERNQTLLAAAIRGIRTVSIRMETLRNGPGELNTYDKTGQRKTLGGQQRNLQRRA